MLTIDRQKLLAVLNPLIRVTTSKSHPIYEYVLLQCEKGEDVLHLTCTNGDLSATARVTMTQSAPAAFQECVQAKLLLDMLKSLANGEILVSKTDKGICIDWGSGKSSLYTADPNDFPNNYIVPEPKLKGSLNVRSLQRALKSAMGATADEDFGRPALSSVNFDSDGVTLNLVASDSHQLVCASMESSLPKGAFLLPYPAAHLLGSILASSESNVIDVSVDDTRVRFDTDDFSVFSALVRAKFPNYRAVIPDNPAGCLHIERERITQIFKRAFIFANKNSGSVSLTLSEGRMKIASEDVGYGMSLNEDITCDYSGPEVSVMVKAAMLIDVLGSINAEKVELGITAPLKPLRVQPDTPEFEGETQVAVIMPTSR